MLNPTELDVRFLHHAARIAYADQFGALCDTPAPARRSRRFAAGLVRATVRLTPRQLRVGRRHAAQA